MGACEICWKGRHVGCRRGECTCNVCMEKTRLPVIRQPLAASTKTPRLNQPKKPRVKDWNRVTDAMVRTAEIAMSNGASIKECSEQLGVSRSGLGSAIRRKRQTPR